MIIIYNLWAVFCTILGAVFGGLVFLLPGLTDETAFIAGAFFVVMTDFVLRFGFNSDSGDEVAECLFFSSKGGAVFWVPCWLIGSFFMVGAIPIVLALDAGPMALFLGVGIILPACCGIALIIMGRISSGGYHTGDGEEADPYLFEESNSPPPLPSPEQSYAYEQPEPDPYAYHSLHVDAYACESHRGEQDSRAATNASLFENPVSSPGREHLRWTITWEDENSRRQSRTFDESEIQQNGSRMIIGRSRSRSDVVVTEPRVSRQHAELFLVGEDIYIRDLGSGNGTSVNGVPLEGTSSGLALHNGDHIQFGKHVGLQFWKGEAH